MNFLDFKKGEKGDFNLNITIYSTSSQDADKVYLALIFASDSKSFKIQSTHLCPSKLFRMLFFNLNTFLIYFEYNINYSLMTSCIKVGSVVYDLVTTVCESEPTYVNNDMVRMVTKMEQNCVTSFRMVLYNFSKPDSSH
jgi:hypothetical protein